MAWIRDNERRGRLRLRERMKRQLRRGLWPTRAGPRRPLESVEARLTMLFREECTPRASRFHPPAR